MAPDVGGAVLELGCGSSTLALDMHRDGYSDVLAVDFAPAAVDVSNELARAAGVSLGTCTGAGADELIWNVWLEPSDACFDL